METMQPALKNGRYAWDRINMPVQEFQDRVKRIRKAMKEEGMDVLLLYGNAFNEYGNYCYLSNTMARLPQGAMVAVPRKGDPTLIFEGASRGVSSVKKITWIDDVRATGDVSKECVNYLKSFNPGPSVIGAAGLKRLMPHHQHQYIRDSLPGCRILDSDRLLGQLRMLKSPMEVLQIRRASRIAARVLEFIASGSFAEPLENVIEAAARREARLEGTEDFRLMMAKPREQKSAFRPPEQRAIQPDDTVIIYVAAEFERYWAEAIRTYTFRNGSFEESQPEQMKTLYKSMLEGVSAGKRASLLYKETAAKISKAKLENISDYGMGQGIGLSLQELPLIAQADRTILEEGMCFSLRLAIRNKDLGAVMVGNTVYLAKKEAEVLTL